MVTRQSPRERLVLETVIGLKADFPSLVPLEYHGSCRGPHYELKYRVVLYRVG
jgi:hypothetical protein